MSANVISTETCTASKRRPAPRPDATHSAVTNAGVAVKPSLGSPCQDFGQEPLESAKDRRFRLRGYAAKLLPKERVADCMVTLRPGAAVAEIHRGDTSGRTWYGNVMTCSRVWLCPVCAQRITAAKRDEIQLAVKRALEMGWSPLMVTFTLAHGVIDKLGDLLQVLVKQAMAALKAERQFKELREEYGWVFDIRALEPTYGANGWHPHLHFLVFCEVELTPALAEGLRAWLSEIWARVLSRYGRHASDAHGVNVRLGDAAVHEYLAKFGHEPAGSWGLPDEMARGQQKRRRHDDAEGAAKGITPFELLEMTSWKADDLRWFGKGKYVGSAKRAAALFVEYAEATKGYHQISWGKGLRAALGMNEPVPDSELVEPAEVEQESSTVVLRLERSAWSRVCAVEAQQLLLNLAAGGHWDALRGFLDGLGIRHVDLSEYDVGPASRKPVTHL